MDERFATAFCAAAAPKILGRRLRPFSLWHEAVLAIVESPFAGGKRPVSFQEFLLAVEICRLKPQAEGFAVPRAPRGIVGRLRLWARLWLWSRRSKAAGRRQEGEPRWHGEYEAFVVYLAEHRAGPEYWATSGGRAISAPWALYLASALIAGGMDPALAWALSPGQARWYRAGLTEVAGNDPGILTDAEREALRAAGY